MATLDRRVQILLDPAQYAELEAEAAAERQSVAAIIRQAVDERLTRRKQPRVDALQRLLASADGPDAPPMKEWSEIKTEIEDDRHGTRPR